MSGEGRVKVTFRMTDGASVEVLGRDEGLSVARDSDRISPNWAWIQKTAAPQVRARLGAKAGTG